MDSASGRAVICMPPDVHGSLSCVSIGTKCWVADSTGLVGCLDLSLRKTQQVLKGSGGSVRCLSVHPRLPLIASVGLDRFLRVHNTETRQLGYRSALPDLIVCLGGRCLSKAIGWVCANIGLREGRKVASCLVIAGCS